MDSFENRKIRKSFQDLESLFVLLPYLDDTQLISLKKSLSIFKNYYLP